MAAAPKQVHYEHNRGTGRLRGPWGQQWIFLQLPDRGSPVHITTIAADVLIWTLQRDSPAKRASGVGNDPHDAVACFRRHFSRALCLHTRAGVNRLVSHRHTAKLSPATRSDAWLRIHKRHARPQRYESRGQPEHRCARRIRRSPETG